MKSWLNHHYNFEYNQVDLLLNNCSSHKNSLTLYLFKNLHIQKKYIPTYSSEFVLIDIYLS